MIEDRSECGTAWLAESVVASGYASIVLDRLARQACELVGGDRSCLLVRDRRTPRTTIAVAGHGRDEAIVGDRFFEDAALGGAVDWGQWTRSIERTHDRAEQGNRVRVALPIRRDGELFGALTAGAGAPSSFGERELNALSDVALLAGAALAHAEQRSEILPRARARVLAFVSAIDARDGYTAGHCETVVRLTRALGELLGLSAPDLLELELAALLHDLGKVTIPDAILRKPSALDSEEQILMRQHAESGHPCWWMPPDFKPSQPSCAVTTSAGTAPATPTGSRAHASR